MHDLVALPCDLAFEGTNRLDEPDAKGFNRLLVLPACEIEIDHRHRALIPLRATEL